MNFVIAKELLDTMIASLRALLKKGVTWEDFKIPVENDKAGDNLAKFLKAGCPDFEIVSKKPEAPVVFSLKGYDLAMCILGKDFIPPEENVKYQNVFYGNEVLRHFAQTLPPREVLLWLRNNDFALIAGPPREMSFSEIYDLNSQLFSEWYKEDCQNFFREDKVTANWLMLRKGIIPNSAGKYFEEQQTLLCDLEYVPNSAEVVWGETTYKKIFDKWLFPDVLGRISSVSVKNGNPICVGDSLRENGVYLTDQYSTFKTVGIGISSARKRE